MAEQHKVIIPDLQVPYHSEAMVKRVAKFIRAYKPTEVACVGDELDAPQVSRWSRGRPGEYTRDLGKDRDECCRVLEALQVQHISRSNHTDRLENYLEKHAPGLLGLDELRIENVLRTEELGIKYHHRLYRIAPGWLLGHGDEGSLIQAPGGTALNIAKRLGKSFIGGHTHRAGQQHWNHYVHGELTYSLQGVEVGHLMDMRKADYLKAGAANWQPAFAIMHVEDGSEQKRRARVSVELVKIQRDGSFYAAGRWW